MIFNTPEKPSNAFIGSFHMLRAIITSLITPKEDGNYVDDNILKNGVLPEDPKVNPIYQDQAGPPLPEEILR